MNAEPFRTLSWSAWLGWQIESNWADLRLFVLYLVVKPVCGSMMLVCMFYAAREAERSAMPDDPAFIAANQRVKPEFLPYMFVSSACYGLVGTVLFGMSYVVISDRESYRMLKYIYISPARFQAYFLGRGLARGLEGVVGGAITFAVGMLIPPIRDAVSFDVGWLLVYLAIGGVMLWAGGMILASAMLNMSRSGMFLSEGIAGVVYLLSGVVFPLSVLPTWLQPVSQLLPTTYWLEGMRRTLTRPTTADSPLSGYTNADLAVLLVATTVLLVAVSQWFYLYSVRKAWRNGRLEETTGM